MPDKSRLLGALAAFAVVLLYGLLWSIEHHPEPRRLMGDENRYWEVGTGEDVSDFYDDRPDLLWPPLYSKVIGWVTPLGGTRSRIQTGQALLLVAIAILCRQLWLVWVGTQRGGWCLFFLVLLYPVLPAYTFYLWPEILHLFLFLLAVWILATRRVSYSWLVALGLILGLARLSKGILGPFLPILLLPLLVGGSWRRRVSRLAVVVISFVVCVAPTVLENGRREGVYTVSSSGVFNLWVGLNDQSRRNFDGEIASAEYLRYRSAGKGHRERSAAAAGWIRDFVAERGSIRVLLDQADKQYHRLFDRVSFLGDMLPGGAAHRVGLGYVDPPPWQARLLRRWSYLLWGAILIGAVLGLVVTPWRGRPWLQLMLLFVAYNLAVLFFLHVKTRYRVQFLPILMFWSVLGFEWLVDPDRSMPDAWRWVPGGVAASLLLLFAFGRGFVY